MKRLFVFFLIFFLFVAGAPVGVRAQEASFFRFVSSGNDVELGDYISVNLLIDPGGVPVDTVRFSFSYPSDRLEIISFTPSSKSVTVSPGSGYDNATGLFSWGTFFTSSPPAESFTLGTVIFQAHDVGESSLLLLDSSRLLSAGKQISSLDSTDSYVLRVGDSGEVAPESFEFEVRSTTHPDQGAWYPFSDVELEWDVVDDFSFYEVGVTQDPSDVDYERVADGSFTSRSLASGTWFFFVRGVNSSGERSAPVSFVAHVDSIPPAPFVPIVEILGKNEEGAAVEYRFASTDKQSGVALYELVVDGESRGFVTSPYVLEGIVNPVTEIALFAYDRAGNRTEHRDTLRLDFDTLEPYGDSGFDRMRGLFEARLLRIFGGVFVLLCVIGLVLVFGRNYYRKLK